MANPGAAGGGLNAQQLQQILTAVRPARKVEPFSTGTSSDWLVWRSNFQLTATINGWSNQRQRREIAASMQGTAKLRVSAIPLQDGVPPGQADAAPAAGLLDAYEAIFVVAAASDLARADFRHAMQGAEESILDFHGRLRTLFQRSYPTLTPAEVEASTDLRETFLRRLRDSEVGKDVFRRRPASYQAALDEASDAEAAHALWADDAVWPDKRVNAMGSRDRSVHFRTTTNGCYICNGSHQAKHCPHLPEIRKHYIPSYTQDREGGMGRGRLGSGRGHSARGGPRGGRGGQGGRGSRGRFGNDNRRPGNSNRRDRRSVYAMEESSEAEGDYYGQEPQEEEAGYAEESAGHQGN